MNQEELEIYRKNKSILFSIFLFGGIALFILSIVLLINFSSEDTSTIFIVFAFVSIILTIVGSVATYSCYSKKYREFINNLEQELMPEVNFNSGIDPDYKTFMSPQFFRKPDRYTFSNYAYCEGELPWFTHNYVLEEIHRDKDGNISYQTYAKGKFYLFDFKREFNQIVRVTERSFFGNSVNITSLKPIETEYYEFNKKFKIQCTDPLTAFYILTPQIQEKIMEFEQSFNGKLFLSFQNSCLCVCLEGVESYHSCNIYSSLNGDKINRIKTMIMFPKIMIEQFKLSSDKFNSDKEYNIA